MAASRLTRWHPPRMNHVFKTPSSHHSRTNHTLHPPQRPLPRQPRLLHPLPDRRTIIYLPAILQPSLWRSLVPRFLRRDPNAPNQPEPKKGWNPATFFIWMALLIGSQGIQMLALQNSFAKFTRETDAKLELLRDVVRRVKAGEDVDVEKVLGTGNEAREKEWEDVVKELEAEDEVFRAKRKRRREDQHGGAEQGHDGGKAKGSA